MSRHTGFGQEDRDRDVEPIEDRYRHEKMAWLRRNLRVLTDPVALDEAENPELRLYFENGEHDLVRLEYREALAEFERARSVARESEALSLLPYCGLCHIGLGDPESAREAFADTLRTARRASLPRVQVAGLVGLALIQAAYSRTSPAIRMLERASELARRSRYHAGCAFAELNIGLLYRQLEKNAEADRAFARAFGQMSLSEEVDLAPRMLAGTEFHCPEDVERVFDHLARIDGWHDGFEQRHRLNNAGFEAIMEGYFVRARRLFREALVIVRKLKDRWGEAMTLYCLATSFPRKRFARRCIVLLEASIDLLRRINDPAAEARHCITAGDVYSRLHEFDGAMRHYVRSYRLSLRLGNQQALVSSAGRLVGVLGACGDLELFATLCAEHGVSEEDLEEAQKHALDMLSEEERRKLEDGEWEDEGPPPDPWDEEED
jgi:tetratricopeptide (TPR) repeat protein